MSGSVYADTATTRLASFLLRRSRATWVPPPPGILTSTSATSGVSTRARSIAEVASRAVPTTSIDGSEVTTSVISSRISCSSSASITRIRSMDVAPLHRRRTQDGPRRRVRSIARAIHPACGSAVGGADVGTAECDLRPSPNEPTPSPASPDREHRPGPSRRSAERPARTTPSGHHASGRRVRYPLRTDRDPARRETDDPSRSRQGDRREHRDPRRLDPLPHLVVLGSRRARPGGVRASGYRLLHREPAERFDRTG